VLLVTNTGSGRTENDKEWKNLTVAVVGEDEGRDVVAELLRRGSVVREVEGDEAQPFPRSAGFGVDKHDDAELAQLAVMAGTPSDREKRQLRQI
jgi:hypothetical protein